MFIYKLCWRELRSFSQYNPLTRKSYIQFFPKLLKYPRPERVYFYEFTLRGVDVIKHLDQGSQTQIDSGAA